MIVKLCEICGERITNQPKAKSRFCSQKCFGVWFAKIRTGAKRRDARSSEHTCEVCGKTFRVAQSRAALGYGRFCSKTCKGRAFRGIPGPLLGRPATHLYKRTEATCEQCGKIETVQQYRGSRRFCSRACHAKWQAESGSFTGDQNPRWMGGAIEHYYGPNWRQQRRNARQRDKYTCQHCGKTEKQLGKQLDVHHIIPFRSFGVERYKEANTVSNLISLCTSCHLRAEPRNQRSL